MQTNTIRLTVSQRAILEYLRGQPRARTSAQVAQGITPSQSYAQTVTDLRDLCNLGVTEAVPVGNNLGYQITRSPQRP